MSIKQFESLPDEDVIFRIAEIGKSFLPKDAKLPTAAFFEPTKQDKDEALKRNRPPGLSVWNHAYSTPSQAARIRFAPNTPQKDELRIFDLQCGRIRNIGTEMNIILDIVSDSLSPDRGPGAAGHSLIEGLARPAGEDKNSYKRLKSAIADACTECPWTAE